MHGPWVQENTLPWLQIPPEYNMVCTEPFTGCFPFQNTGESAKAEAPSYNLMPAAGFFLKGRFAGMKAGAERYTFRHPP